MVAQGARIFSDVLASDDAHRILGWCLGNFAGSVDSTVLVWLRGEVLVQWSGDPAQPPQRDPSGRMNRRHSFLTYARTG